MRKLSHSLKRYGDSERERESERMVVIHEVGSWTISVLWLQVWALWAVLAARHNSYWPWNREEKGESKLASQFPLKEGVSVLPIHLSQGQNSSLGLESLMKVASLSIRHFPRAWFDLLLIPSKHQVVVSSFHEWQERASLFPNGMGGHMCKPGLTHCS